MYWVLHRRGAEQIVSAMYHLGTFPALCESEEKASGARGAVLPQHQLALRDPNPLQFHLCQLAASVVETVNLEHQLELFYLLHGPLDNQIQIIILILKFIILGIPGWLRDLAPAFGPGRDPGVPESSPTSGSQHGACFSLCLCLCLSLSLSLSLSLINK